ncbi:kinase-like domain-containing protein [Pisolithus croceorrhizus]|nr:kinase-like domain-containing protein [Pisolithus croceorrhizus]KAI6107529.1 kinase-like domain-containing protein [Pisolithus croceorrhizus]KAI6163412.1 kinase-like domain-containing protein [Pisolithus thermaeus]
MSPTTDLTGQLRLIGGYAIAHGGNSDIWKGEWKDQSNSPFQVVAVKVIKSHLLPDKAAEANYKLQREARVWAALSNPNVVPLLGMAFDLSKYGGPSLVSPWYPNGNLKQYMLQHYAHLSFRQRLEMLYQLANGLQYLHTSNVVHGDLKPGNVLIGDSGELVITDFGLSRILEVAGFTTNNVHGTVRYFAPELCIIESDRPSRKTKEADVWALAVTATEMFSLRTPYEGETDAAVLLYVSRNNGHLKREHYNEITDDDLWSLLERCWRYEPRRRPRIDGINEFLRIKRDVYDTRQCKLAGHEALP